MEEILHQLIGSLSHSLQGSIHVRWCRISTAWVSLVCVCFPLPGMLRQGTWKPDTSTESAGEGNTWRLSGFGVWKRTEELGVEVVEEWPSPKLTVKAPENGWLDNEFPFGMAYFQGRTVIVLGSVRGKKMGNYREDFLGKKSRKSVEEWGRVNFFGGWPKIVWQPKLSLNCPAKKCFLNFDKKTTKHPSKKLAEKQRRYRKKNKV